MGDHTLVLGTGGEGKCHLSGIGAAGSAESQMGGMRKSEESSVDDGVYHTLDAQGSHDMKESFGITVYWDSGRPTIVLKIFRWARSTTGVRFLLYAIIRFRTLRLVGRRSYIAFAL